jgi:hypothetical protein
MGQQVTHFKPESALNRYIQLTAHWVCKGVDFVKICCIGASSRLRTTFLALSLATSKLTHRVVHDVDATLGGKEVIVDVETHRHQL